MKVGRAWEFESWLEFELRARALFGSAYFAEDAPNVFGWAAYADGTVRFGRKGYFGIGVNAGAQGAPELQATELVLSVAGEAGGRVRLGGDSRLRIGARVEMGAGLWFWALSLALSL